MAGKTTHDQQVRIIETREDASNAPKGFDAEEELRRPEQERQARREGADLRSGGVELTDPDDRNMLTGTNQESRHNKHRADD
jgi:hypothetical protein